jgi:hypothetical protein
VPKNLANYSNTLNDVRGECCTGYLGMKDHRGASFSIALCPSHLGNKRPGKPIPTLIEIDITKTKGLNFVKIAISHCRHQCQCKGDAFDGADDCKAGGQHRDAQTHDAKSDISNWTQSTSSEGVNCAGPCLQGVRSSGRSYARPEAQSSLNMRTLPTFAMDFAYS